MHFSRLTIAIVSGLRIRFLIRTSKSEKCFAKVSGHLRPPLINRVATGKRPTDLARQVVSRQAQLPFALTNIASSGIYPPLDGEFVPVERRVIQSQNIRRDNTQLGEYLGGRRRNSGGGIQKSGVAGVRE
jgi:hypothetical protein